MSVTIQNNVIVDVLGQHLGGRVRSAVNFTFKSRDRVQVQSSNDFVLDTIVKCDASDDMVGTSFTVLIDKAIGLLSCDEEGFTVVSNLGDRILFDHGDISIPFPVAFDERVDLKLDSLEMCGSVNCKDLVEITRNFKRLLNISKSLEKGVPSVIVSSGRSFCLYSNTMLIDNAPMALPDFEIPYNTFSNITKNLTGSKVEVYIDSSKKILAFVCGNDNVLLTTYKTPNLDTIKAIDAKIWTLKSIGSFGLDNLKAMELAYKCFTKETLTMSFYDDHTIGFALSLSDGKNIRAGIKDKRSLSNIVISTAQLDSFYKVFSLSTKIDVMYDRDVMCFESAKGAKLLLSGMTF